MTLAITDLQVEIGKDTRHGWVQVPVDLNMGAGGEYEYVHFRRGTGQPITGVTVIVGKDTKPPDKYTKINLDLNKGASGAYLYLCYKKGSGTPITNLIVQATEKQDGWRYGPPGYENVPIDLNKGAGGRWIYLWYQRRTPEAPLDLSRGIQPRMLTSTGTEYEIASAQLSPNRLLIRFQKIKTVEIAHLQPGDSATYEFTVSEGMSEEHMTQITREISTSISSSIKISILNLGSTVNDKLAITEQHKYTTSKQVVDKRTYSVSPKDYPRQVGYFQAVDVLRIVKLPSFETVAEAETALGVKGFFTTNKQGWWVEA